jgi:vacuolar protein sorting-associated protein 11
VVEDEVMALLKDPDSRYDADHALVLVQQYHFEPGMMYLYEKRKMYHMLVQRYMDSGNHRAILATCRKYGQRDPNLWVQVLTYLAASYGTVAAGGVAAGGQGGSSPQQCARYIQQVLQLGSAFLPPLLVLSILSKNRNLPVSIVHEYLVKHLRAEQQAIRDDAADVQEHTREIERIRAQMHRLETSAKVFQHSTDQLIPDQPLALPVIHFMSGNSYNLENVESVPDTPIDGRSDGSGATTWRRVDPNMAEDQHRLAHMLNDLQEKSQRHEDFYREMQAAGRGEGSITGFDKVAEYFGLGVFDHPRGGGGGHGRRTSALESPSRVRGSTYGSGSGRLARYVFLGGGRG